MELRKPSNLKGPSIIWESTVHKWKLLDRALRKRWGHILLFTLLFFMNLLTILDVICAMM